MIFNSVAFVLFFVIVFFVYWFPLNEKTQLQNYFLLLSSWFFYGNANWRILPLLILACVIYFFLGREIERHKDDKWASRLSTLGVLIGVGTLLYFKYFNFFIESFASLFNSFGLQTNIHTFNIIMPLGISFFTFRLLSYVIDINRGKVHHTDDFITFATYISFFPCLLSGPIDRPKFIGQLESKRTFNYDQAVDGCRQILWGLFKKVVVADNCAIYVDSVWKNVSSNSGSTLALASILYLFQIYADFSGYSDMAIGIGKLLGFKIADNFKSPLFALNIADYWRRWHITLTSWLTDYVFMPLNIKFRDLGNRGIILSIIITFVLIGLWHGANWTFALFGLYHGILYIPLIISGSFYKKTKIKTNKIGLPVFKDFCHIVFTMLLVVLGLILFRADSLNQAWEFINGICNVSFLSRPLVYDHWHFIILCCSILFCVFMEWSNRHNEHGFSKICSAKIIRFWTYIVLWYIIYAYMLLHGHTTTYLYFQF